MSHKRLGEILVANGHLSKERLDLALNVQKRTKERLGSILTRLGFLRDEDLGEVVAEQYGLTFLRPAQIIAATLDAEGIDKLTLDFALSHTLLPLIVDGQKSLVVADILDTKGTDHAHAVLGRRPLLASTRSAIATALETYSFGGKDGEKIVERARDAISKGEINELLGYLLGRAVLRGVSDIHIEPSGPVSVVRFRIDGVLQPEISVPRERHDNLVNVLFGKAGIDLSDFHRLRDGRFSFQFAGRALDVRFASSPTVEGPMVVMRILDDTRSLLSLDRLGYADWNLAAISRMVRHPFGVILLVGPTGSGKTTTLYSLLASLNDTQKKILTVEDPVEIKLPSVQQVQVNDKAGVTFASAIRGFLRQDPDIILVGEIRDTETAREAFRAANTGHLVLTTLHANSAIESPSRLIDLGLDSYRVADGVIGIVAQRLVRGICRKCAVPADLEELPHALAAGPGCKSCRGGYVGRRVVAEVLEFTDELRDLIHRHQPTHQIREVARKNGFKVMLDNARALVERGETTVEEVERTVGPLFLAKRGGKTVVTEPVVLTSSMAKSAVLAGDGIPPAKAVTQADQRKAPARSSSGSGGKHARPARPAEDDTDRSLLHKTVIDEPPPTERTTIVRPGKR